MISYTKLQPKTAVKWITFTLLVLTGADEAFGQLDTVHRIPPMHSRANVSIGEQYLYISTPKAASFNVRVTDGSGNPLPNSPFQVSNSSPTRVFVGTGQSPATELMVPNDSLGLVLKSRGLKLTAPKPFYANVRYNQLRQAASLTAKGQAAEGKTFRIGAMPLPKRNTGFTSRNFVTGIQATEDNTTVKVKDYDKGVEFEWGKFNNTNLTNDSLNIQLDKGETYILSGYTDIQANLEGFVGALIESNKPIVVNTGNYLGTIGNNTGQDAGVDQIVPEKNTGKKYALVEGEGPAKQEEVLVVAQRNNTKIFLNGNNTPNKTLQAGDWHLVPNSFYTGGNHGNMYIRTSKPAYVHQMINGSSKANTIGMNFMAPLNCGLPQKVDQIPDITKIGSSSYNGNIIAITKRGETLKVNGSIQTGAEPLSGNNKWESYKIAGKTGDVKVTSTGALVSGFLGASGAAGYGGLFSGFSLDLQADFAYQDTISYTRETSGCFNDTINIAFTGEREPGTEFKWEFGKASALNPSGNPSQFSQSNQGPYQLFYRSQDYDSVVRDSVKLVVKDGDCEDSVTKAIRIFEVDPRKPATLQNISVLKDQVVKVNFKGIDVRDLNRYEVLRRKGGSGAFQQVDEVVNPDTPNNRFTVLDTVGTRDTQLCYSIATVRGCKKPAYSDTFCAVQLGGGPANNATELTWQPFAGYPIDSQLVLRKRGSGYDTIARLGNLDTSYTDQPLPCNVTQRYKVLSYEKGGERTTLSDSVRLTPFDTLAPGAPRIQRLSILSDTEARLSWLRNDSSVTRHELQLKAGEGQSWRIIDTVGLQNSYTFSGLDTRDSQYCARIVGIDSCADNRSAFSKTHCAVQLEGTAGNLKNILNWEAYKGFTNPSYDVQRLNSGSWQVLGSTSDTSYTDSINLTCGVTERYRIRTISGDQADTSFSDTTAVTPVDTIAPPAADLRYASADLAGEVKLEWNWQPTTNQKFFEVWRSEGPGTSFSVQDTVVLDSTYTDQTASPRTTDHQYYIIATDSCRAQNVATSDTDRLVTPTVQTGFCDPKNQLRWNRYDDLPQGTDVYEIYRKQPGSGNPFRQQTTNSAQQTSYTDTLVQDRNTYCYRIKAIDSQSGYSSFTDSFCRKVFEYPEPDTPDIISASVTQTGQSDGAVKLTWQRYSADTFAEGYYLYHSDQGSSGPYQRIDTLTDPADTSFTHTGINTADSRNSYRLVVYNLCGDTSAFSETHNTINLEAKKKNLDIQLDWSAYEGFPRVAGYDVERATDGGPWETIEFLIRDTGLIDTSVQCGKRYTYRIVAYDQPGNRTYSDTVVREASDTIKPAEPTLISASVTRTGTDNGAARLNWQPSASSDVEQYAIRHYQPAVGEFRTIDLVSGDSTDYLHQGVNTADRPNRYFIAAIDSCDNRSGSQKHRTIQLEADGTSEAVRLNWTAYQGDQVLSYQIVRGDSLLYELPADSTRKLDQSVRCDSTYPYQIRAVLASDSTVVLSNTDQAEPFDNTPPDPVRLQRVSVSRFNEVVEVSWQPTGSDDRQAVEVFRSTADSRGPQLVGTVTDQQASTFYDTLAITEQAELCYQVRATDGCGNSTRLSQPDCLIQLEGEARDDLTNRLSWPPYRQWNRGVQQYEVFKKRSDSLYTPIARLDSSTRTYTDEDLADSADQFCYYIRAEGFGTAQYSRSTRICLEQSAVVYIPNTFTPANSFTINDQFGPEGLYIDNYQMQIYNRWGEQVFSTSESEKWDGTHNGELVPQGVYHYQIRIRSEDGTTRSFQGRITIVR